MFYAGQLIAHRQTGRVGRCENIRMTTNNGDELAPHERRVLMRELEGGGSIEAAADEFIPAGPVLARQLEDAAARIRTRFGDDGRVLGRAGAQLDIELAMGIVNDLRAAVR